MSKSNDQYMQDLIELFSKYVSTEKRLDKLIDEIKTMYAYPKPEEKDERSNFDAEEVMLIKKLFSASLNYRKCIEKITDHIIAESHKENRREEMIEKRIKVALKIIQKYGYPIDVIKMFERLEKNGVRKSADIGFYIKKYDIYFRQGGWI